MCHSALLERHLPLTKLKTDASSFFFFHPSSLALCLPPSPLPYLVLLPLAFLFAICRTWFDTDSSTSEYYPTPEVSPPLIY